MAQVVDVDEEALKQIADSMRSLVERMDRVCQKLEGNIGESIPLMQDESGAKACDQVLADVADLRKIFPSVMEFSDTCYEIIKCMQDAVDSLK